MNRWNDSLEKSKPTSDNKHQCNCTSNQGLFVPNRQLSALIAGLFFLFFCIFITGYFLGKKTALEQFTQQMQSDALGDTSNATALLNEIVYNNSDNNALMVSHEKNNNTENVSHEISHEVPMIPQEAMVTLNQDIVIPDAHDHKQYYAQLIGFGTEKAATQFVKRLSMRGITTELKKRVSKTAKGNTSYWYQVVTMAYNDRDELSRIVDKVVKDEKLKDVCIRIC